MTHTTTTTDDVVRRFTDGDALVTTIIADPGDAQLTRYGVVTRWSDASLVGTYYPTDLARQIGWTVVTAAAKTYHYASEPAAVQALADLAATPQP